LTFKIQISPFGLNMSFENAVLNGGSICFSEEDAFNVNASHEIASVQTITDSRIIGDDGSISINDSDNRSHKSR